MPVTKLLVGLNVAVYVLMVLKGVSAVSPTVPQLLHWGANFGPLSLGPQPWRIWTSNYVHIGIIHIALNMWCLWSLGVLAERIFPPWTYLFLYTACGIGGSLASLWWHPMVVGAGASGAIFGLAGALIAVFYLGKLPISQDAVKGTLRSLITFAAYNLFFGLTAGIDNFAHLGGLVTGLAFGAAIAKHVAAPPEIRIRWQRYASFAMAIVLTGAGVLVKRQYPNIQNMISRQTVTPATPPNSSPASSSENEGAALEHAEGLYEQGDYEQASKEVEAILKTDPNNPDGHYLRGLVQLKSGSADDAIAEFEKTLQLDPNFVAAQTGLGLAYEKNGQHQQAEQAFRKASQMQRASH